MPSEGQLILVLRICRIGAGWQNLAQLPQIMDRDTLKALLKGKGNLQVKLNLF